jgi:hypothetical protein
MLPWLADIKAGTAVNTAGDWSFSIAKYGPQMTTPWNCGNESAHAPDYPDASDGVVTVTWNGITGCIWNYVQNDPSDAYVKANSGDFQKQYVQSLVSKYGDSTTKNRNERPRRKQRGILKNPSLLCAASGGEFDPE